MLSRRSAVSVAAGSASLILYLCTLHPGVGGEINHGDSAKFQFLGVVPGVGHSPGNPLYLALLFLVQAFPLGSPALRANLLSALLGAAAVGFTADTAYRLRGARAAVFAALALGLGSTYWEFATEAEVYSLSALATAVAIHALARFNESPESAFTAHVCALIVGFSNHLSLVLAIPATLIAVTKLSGLRPQWPAIRWRWVAAAVAVTGFLYALLPLLDRFAVYSEYPRVHTFQSFLFFVTGARWHNNMDLGSLAEALGPRSLFLTEVLLKQWILPLWLVVPLALYVLHKSAKVVASFCAFTLLAWFMFLFAYRIPDPDGLVVSMACCAAPALGVLASRLRPAVGATLAILLLAPTAWLRAQKFYMAMGFDVMETVTSKPKVALDLPDAMRRMPQGAYLIVPCGHYGCVMMTNYYRFADPLAREKQIRIVLLDDPASWPWESMPPQLRLADARAGTVCTFSSKEADWFKQQRLAMRTIERGTLEIHGTSHPRIPLYCSVN